MSEGAVSVERSGACLCGKVSLKAQVDAEIGACHCSQCQRWTGGGPLLSVRVSDLDWSGEEHITEFSISDWGIRAFCRHCGSTLYWRMSDGPVRHVAVGLLDDQSDLRLTEEIFVDYRPDWLNAVPDASQSTEADQYALLEEYLKNKARQMNGSDT